MTNGDLMYAAGALEPPATSTPTPSPTGTPTAEPSPTATPAPGGRLFLPAVLYDVAGR
jgi:hypothetical protein